MEFTHTTCMLFVLIYIFQSKTVVELLESTQRQMILTKHLGAPLQDPVRQQVHKFQEGVALISLKVHTTQLQLVVMQV